MKSLYFKFPSKVESVAFFLFCAVTTLIFIFVYGGANYLSSLSETPYNIQFNWERDIPFIPQWIIIYFSLNLLTLIPLFVINLVEIIRLGLNYIVATLIAGFCFIIFPAKMAFARPDSVEQFQFLFNLLHTYDKPYNLAPSLHITFSAITLLFLIQKNSIGAKVIFVFWFLAMCLSVLFTHQHHFIDVVTGSILALLVFKLSHSKFGDNIAHKLSKRFI